MAALEAVTEISRENFAAVLKSLLDECRAQLQQIERKPALKYTPPNSSLFWDLTAAIGALEVIEKEILEGHQRPKGQRSAAFTRYVIDERPQMAMDTHLRDLIVQLEDVYDDL